MSSIQSNPILNQSPAAGNSFGGAMREILGLNALQHENLLPARVVSYDRVNNTAVIQPMLKLVDMNENTRSRNQISNIPVLSMGGGGFHINFPLKPGDLGWILASDRDISLFLKNLDEARPTTLRTHKFNDAWFIPDVFRKYTINGADTDAMVIQSTTGSTRIAISEGVINITAPTSVTVTTPIATFSQDVQINGKLTVNGNTALKANLVVTGPTAVNGGFNATGGGNLACTLPQSTTIGGIAVYGHGHIQTAVSGQRTSGGMTA
jgi:hypothetical protein